MIWSARDAPPAFATAALPLPLPTTWDDAADDDAVASAPASPETRPEGVLARRRSDPAPAPERARARAGVGTDMVA